MKRIFAAVIVVAVVAVLLSSAGLSVQAQTSQPQVLVLTASGPLSP